MSKRKRRRTRTPCGWSLAMLLNGKAASCEHENWTRLRALEQTPQRVRTESRRESSSSSIEAVSREMEEPRTHAQWGWRTRSHDREMEHTLRQRETDSGRSTNTSIRSAFHHVSAQRARSSPCPHKVATHLSLRASHHLGGLHSEDPFFACAATTKGDFRSPSLSVGVTSTA